MRTEIVMCRRGTAGCTEAHYNNAAYDPECRPLPSQVEALKAAGWTQELPLRKVFLNWLRRTWRRIPVLEVRWVQRGDR